MGMKFKIDHDAAKVAFTLTQCLSFDDIIREYVKQLGGVPAEWSEEDRRRVVERFVSEYVDFTDFGTPHDYLEEVMENVINEEDI